jgi:predicted PurR-regulated permease PerM
VPASALVVIALVAGTAALSVASSVFAPAAFALFVIALVWPLQSRLQRHLPRLVALLACVIVMATVFAVFGWLIAWAFGRVGRWTMSEAARFQMLYDQAVVWLEGHGIMVSGIWAEHFNVGWILRLVQTLTGRVNSAMSFWIVVFVYVVLGLLEVGQFRQRAQAIGDEDMRRVLVEGGRTTAAKLRRYMLVRSQMSILTGLLVWGFASLAGLQLAGEWGVIAFTLNYVPFIGPLIATLFPTALALVQFESLHGAIIVFACLNLIQFVVGSYIEPRVSGTALSISPSIVLFSVFFWTWMWGFLGSVIGVPITISILTFCANHPASRWLSDLLSGTESTPETQRTADQDNGNGGPSRSIRTVSGSSNSNPPSADADRR